MESTNTAFAIHHIRVHPAARGHTKAEPGALFAATAWQEHTRQARGAKTARYVLRELIEMTIVYYLLKIAIYAGLKANSATALDLSSTAQNQVSPHSNFLAKVLFAQLILGDMIHYPTSTNTAFAIHPIPALHVPLAPIKQEVGQITAHCVRREHIKQLINVHSKAKYAPALGMLSMASAQHLLLQNIQVEIFLAQSVLGELIPKQEHPKPAFAMNLIPALHVPLAPIKQEVECQIA
jgi:hypothetical protein